MSVFRLFVIFLLAKAFGPSTLFAQACCSGGVPISSNLGLISKESGQLQIQLTYDYNTLRDLMTFSERLDDDSRTRNTHSLLLESSYDFSETFSISTLFSWVRQERIISTLIMTEDITINQGPGDAILLFRYKVLGKKEGSRSQLIMGAGPKFPLGRADYTDSRGIILPADLQPGTGAWDAMLWGNYSLQRIMGRDNLSFNMNATTRLTTTNDRYNGRQAYKFGNEFQFQAGFQDRFLLGSLLVDPMLILRYRTVGIDKVNGNDFDNTGGHWLYLRPGININPAQHTAIRIMGDIPLYRWLSGIQLTTSYRLAISFYQSLNFGRKNKSPFSVPLSF